MYNFLHLYRSIVASKARIMGSRGLFEGAVSRKMAVCFCSNFIIFGKISYLRGIENGGGLASFFFKKLCTLKL